MIASRACFGEYMRNMSEDIDNADTILVWGANPTTDSSPINLPRLMRARRRGAKIVVIDHRRSETAQATKAEWIGIRPLPDSRYTPHQMHVVLGDGFVVGRHVPFEFFREQHLLDQVVKGLPHLYQAAVSLAGRETRFVGDATLWT